MEFIKDAKLEEEDKIILALLDKTRFNENILIVLRGNFIGYTEFNEEDNEEIVKECIDYHSGDETERNKLQFERLKELAKWQKNKLQY